MFLDKYARAVKQVLAPPALIDAKNQRSRQEYVLQTVLPVV